jgi:hypothetical protein
MSSVHGENGSPVNEGHFCDLLNSCKRPCGAGLQEILPKLEGLRYYFLSRSRAG